MGRPPRRRGRQPLRPSGRGSGSWSGLKHKIVFEDYKNSNKWYPEEYEAFSFRINERLENVNLASVVRVVAFIGPFCCCHQKREERDKRTLWEEKGKREAKVFAI